MLIRYFNIKIKHTNRVLEDYRNLQINSDRYKVITELKIDITGYFSNHLSKMTLIIALYVTVQCNL